MQTRPATPTGYISVDSLRYVADYVNIQLKGMPYTFIGGVACSLLRSSHLTHDFDIIVLDRQKDAALRQLASNSKAFSTDGCGIWAKTLDGKQYNLDIIEPRQIGQVFTGDDVIVVRGMKVLHPSALLRYKQYAYANRVANRQTSQANYEADLRFLSNYLQRIGGK